MQFLQSDVHFLAQHLPFQGANQCLRIIVKIEQEYVNQLGQWRVSSMVARVLLNCFVLKVLRDHGSNPSRCTAKKKKRYTLNLLFNLGCCVQC